MLLRPPVRTLLQLHPDRPGWMSCSLEKPTFANCSVKSSRRRNCARASTSAICRRARETGWSGWTVRSIATTTQDLADQYFPLARATLGGDSPVRYLVLFQNPAELRPSGGFPGTMGIVEFERGQLS